MPALNFTKFISAVEDGSKPLTIRDIRKNPIRPGDVLYMFTGMRTRQCRPLKMPGGPLQIRRGKGIVERCENATICRASLRIVFDWKPENAALEKVVGVVIGDTVRLLTANEERDLCRLDGFANVGQFWGYHIPFAQRLSGQAPYTREKDLYIYGELPPGPFRSMLEMYAPYHVKKALGI